ncbi:MAG: family 10 glycosylhydrolase [Candidatus Hydrogenedentes bacterium]|nr:family 10 glycosylhydrolase [Candidatus Hydrogenedentota bacterium]
MVSCVVLCLAISTPLLGVGADKTPFIINEDNSHFFGSRNAGDMTLDGLHAFVDQYAGTAVTHLFLNPNAMRASHESAARDAIWEVGDQVVPDEPEFCRKWVDNARLLHERGLDPYAVWIARCREKGISPWLTMRMNDVHDVNNPKNFMHSTFWVKHPDYWRVPGSTGAWQDRALNYGIPEVREHAMVYVKELFERYDPDGIELDWMRFGYHFKPGEEAKGRDILTQFMRDVRALSVDWSQKRGHPIQIGARVPAVPDAAYGLGMDGVTWVKEDLVDVLVPTPFWASIDFDIPVEEWRARLGDSAKKITLAPGGEILIAAYPGAKQTENTLSSARGFASMELMRGADAIYLFNYMDPAPMHGGVEAYRSLLEEGIALKTLVGKERRFVSTYHDTVPAGVSNGAQLPAALADNPVITIYAGPKPPSGKAAVIIGFDKAEGVDEKTLKVSVNGAACSLAGIVEDLADFPGVARAIRFESELSALKDGSNAVAVSGGSGEAKMVWAEIRE